MGYKTIAIPANFNGVEFAAANGLRTPDQIPVDEDPDFKFEGNLLYFLDTLPDSPPLTAISARRARRNDIAATRTPALLEDGFTHVGKTFSLSVAAQLNLARYASADMTGRFPVRARTLDDSEIIELADQAALNAYVAAGFARLNDVVEGGRDFQKQVDDAVTLVAIDAITDNRS